MKIYTRHGDDGTTSMYSGERVGKDSLEIELLGAIDESQAFLGVARAECVQGDALDELLIALERDLWIVMADVATSPSAGSRAPSASIEQAMIDRLEQEIDAATARSDAPAGFAVPGENRLAASLDVARTVVRRAERLAVAFDRSDALIVPYLNRLSDLCWALARASEPSTRTHRGAKARDRRATGEDEDDLGATVDPMDRRTEGERQS